MRVFTFIDLFAGQGGFTAGFLQYGGWRSHLAIDIDEKHCNILRQIFPKLRVLQRSVATVDWQSELGGVKVDCVIGGPPCQPFSRGGHHQNGRSDPRNGWSDPQNGIPLFVNAVKSIKPKVFLMENVAPLWWQRYRPYMKSVIEQFKRMGYVYTDAKILDAADYGSPSHRKRLFVYGTLLEHTWPAKTHANNYEHSGKYLAPLLEQREPDGKPLPEWVKPKIRGAKGDIIVDCKQGNKIGRQYVSLDEPCFTLVASQGIRHRIRFNGKYFRMRAAEAAALQGMDARCSIQGIGNAVNVWQAEAWARIIRDYLAKLK